MHTRDWQEKTGMKAPGSSSPHPAESKTFESCLLSLSSGFQKRMTLQLYANSYKVIQLLFWNILRIDKIIQSLCDTYEGSENLM